VQREPGASPRGLLLPFSTSALSASLSLSLSLSRPDCFVANYEERG